MRVLLATDGSPAADVAVDLVRHLQFERGTAMRVVRVLASAASVRFAGTRARHAIDRIDAEQLGALQRLALSLGRDGVHVEAELLRNDSAADALVAAAADWSADLVVTGSRGHGQIANMVLGSVASALTDRASCPVLVARRPACERVLLADDGSESAAAARNLLATWRVFNGVSTRVLSVAQVMPILHAGIPPTLVAEAHQAEAETLAEARASHQGLANAGANALRTAGIAAEPAMRSGDASAEIIAEAAAWDADLIVMGSRGRTGLSRFFLGSVARNVLLHSASSVLIVRQGVGG